MRLSRTGFLARTTDGRWVRLKPERSTRAKTRCRPRFTQGERPCFVKLRSLSLPPPPSAPSRWLRPPLRRSRCTGPPSRITIHHHHRPSPPWLRLQRRIHRWRLRWLLREPPRVHPVRRCVPHRQRLLLIEPQFRFRNPGRPARPGFSVVANVRMCEDRPLSANADAGAAKSGKIVDYLTAND